MESWLLIFGSIIIFFAALKFIFFRANTKRKLPPGPATLPLLLRLVCLRKPVYEAEPLMRQLRSKYGPIFTIRVGNLTAIFIFDHSLAYEALVHLGSAFSDRPKTQAGLIQSSNQYNISPASYGPTWRLLRLNLMSQILHPSRINSYAQGRKWVLKTLMDRLRCNADDHSCQPISIADHFEYAIFYLHLLMCFGKKLDESIVREIQDIQRRILVSFLSFNVFALFPKIGKIINRTRREGMVELRREQEQLFLPLIKERKERVEDKSRGSLVLTYVDSLLGLELPPEEGESGRKLTEGNIISLCSEFLNAGSDTTSTSLQWIMANLVKQQDVQAKLVQEIQRVVGEKEIREEDLKRMVYLKAVIMEALRRHPPSHLSLPHAVLEEVTLGGYVIPKDATVVFTVADMGWDDKVWDEPMEFRPERFLEGGEGEGVDITGSRGIKMIPFGAGRRICPGMNLALLHLKYFVANLVREFEWKSAEGEEVDLTEKLEFTVVMKKPLRAKISKR